MADEPAPLMDPYEALRLIELFVNVAGEVDNPGASDLILREIRNVLAKALPAKPRRRRRRG